MLRLLAILLVLLSAAAPAAARAAPFLWRVQVCEEDAATRRPDLAQCRARTWLQADPQGRLIWVVASVPGSDAKGRPYPNLALRLSAIASSEVYLNGAFVGRNGVPGHSAAEEQPGRLDASFILPRALWRTDANVLAIRMSSFHSPIRLTNPINTLALGEVAAPPAASGLLAPLIAAGVLLAGCLYFGVLHLANRSRSSLLLCAIAAVALGQAVAETSRLLYAYPYPVHPLRLIAILACASAFSVLLPAFLAERFMRRRRWMVVAAAALAAGMVCLLPVGFDGRTAGVLVLGSLIAAVPVAVGFVRHRREAMFALAALALFFAILISGPQHFIDVSLFVLAAILTTALMIAEVARLQHVGRQREASLVRAATHLDRLSVSTGKGVELVRLDDIVAIVGADDYAELRLRDGRVLLHAARLDELEASLPAPFARIHRSTIVNLTHAVRLLKTGARPVVEMADGASFPVSRSRLAAVRDRFTDSAAAPVAVNMVAR